MSHYFSSFKSYCQFFTEFSHLTFVIVFLERFFCSELVICFGHLLRDATEECVV